MSRVAGTGAFVGRASEMAVLRGAVAGVAAGRGGVVWVEGEPGIGKSALVREALAGDAAARCEVFSAAADRLRQAFPLGVMLDCLGVDAKAVDPPRAEIVRVLRGEQAGGVVPAGDPVVAAADRLCELVDRLCAVSPVVVVLDDLQWADEMSVSVWHRLATGVGSVPLLMVGVARPVPQPASVVDARRGARDRGGALVELGGLAEAEVAAMTAALVGGEPGADLLTLASRAGGNPLYVRELVDALVREDRVRVADGIAELTGVDSGRPVPASLGGPVSLAAAIEGRLGFLSKPTLESLRVAALLGTRFSVADLAVVRGCAVRDLVEVVREAVTAGVLTASGRDLVFRHGLIQQALAEGLPTGLRMELHLEAARALADARAPADKVAGQLLAALPAGAELAPEAPAFRQATGAEPSEPADGWPADQWIADWLTANAQPLVHRAPKTAIELLERVVAATPAGDTRWEVLAEALAGALFLLGREERAEAIASRLLEVTSEPGRRARVTWTLAFALLNQGLPAQALAVLGQALAGPAVPSRWAVRLRSIRALALLNDGQNSDARTQAQAALTEAEQADDRFAACYALSTLINLRLYDNDLRGALQLAEQALAKMGDDPELTDLRLLLMRNRLVLLSRLDPGIRGGAREVLALAERVGTARIGLMRWHLAVDLFDAGQWDDALAELAPMFESGPAASKLTVVACHGLAALIAAHRDDRAALNHHLAAVGHLPDLRPIDLVNVADLTRARALAEERADRSGAAAAMLAPAMRPDFGVDPAVRTYWLAGLVRCALAAGDEPAAREAAQQCEQTAHESQDATLMAIGLRCRGLADADPARLTEAVARLRQVHRPLELAEALEDLAVVCGSRDESVPARAALREAVDLYTGLGADWDILRADARTRPFGVRRGRPGTRRRPASGWDALTSTELKIAYLVAEGLSNPDIGARMFVSWRTVRTHISSIMAKLGVHSRLEIARETDRHPAA